VQLTNLSTGDYDTCAWSFGDGGTSSGCGDPAHTYTISGPYTVSLTVSGLGGADTETKVGYITVYGPPPTVQLSSSAYSVVEGSGAAILTTTLSAAAAFTCDGGLCHERWHRCRRQRLCRRQRHADL